jgi:hypothetical protein
MNTPGASMPPAAAPGTADNYIIGNNTRPANPTPLSAPQEQQVRDLYYKNVRAKCAVEIEGTWPLPTTLNHLNYFFPHTIHLQSTPLLTYKQQPSHNAPSAGP